jgi:hypothetical protein
MPIYQSILTTLSFPLSIHCFDLVDYAPQSLNSCLQSFPLHVLMDVVKTFVSFLSEKLNQPSPNLSILRLRCLDLSLLWS